ncbi:Spo0E family sporulation regulatory protein-aspartic acid phosphatase [Mesobacillus jeotgali]|uniref:Spo0E family sporulation regulatory protein-aspartic acid phosphatase n=1 Tax=Mesobacillus jeotgali TaxID=129985 RepID=UPI0009A68D08
MRYKKMNCSKECLLLVINNLRRKMIVNGISEGLNSLKTVQLSQRLDKVIYKLQKLHDSNK